jgi:hypothetical protein
MSDRTVHASYSNMEIVRYDRSGKWYLEPTIPGLRRQHVTVAQAASSAKYGLAIGGSFTPGLSGGKAFDRLVAG